MWIDLKNKYFTQAMPVMSELVDNGFEAYFVGGCVRDLLLDDPIHDIDIATSARPEEIQAIFPSTIDVGAEHGTIIVLYQQQPYEITTFRTEGKYSDYRRPDSVEFVRDLKEDTLRRDFTINAMACDLDGKLYDYHGGFVDLELGLIRAVGDPSARFQEDALRMMRAVRFASKLGFKIERATFSAIQSLSDLITKIAIERIRIEMDKFLIGDYFFKTYLLLQETGLMAFLPGFSNPVAGQALADLAQDLKPMIENGMDRPLPLVWALLLGHLGLDTGACKNMLRAWTHSNQMISETLEIIEFLQEESRGQLNAWSIYQYSDLTVERCLSYLQVQGVDTHDYLTIWQNLPIKNRQEIVMNGRRLMEYLQMDQGGPIIGRLLQQVEKAIVQGELMNQEEAIKEFIDQYQD
ncbi:CCA tRNA nucleotidyltransferase [Hutsoniella sourekii]